MTIKVQRVPRELLGLLGIVGDSPPASLLEEYRGTVEMINMVIGALPIEQEFAFDADAAVGDTAIVTVPAGEIWFVDGVQTSTTIANTGTMAAHVETYWAGALLSEKYWFAGVTTPTNTGGVTLNDGWFAARGFPIIAKAGENFTSRMANRSGAGVFPMTNLVRFRRVRS